VLTASLERGGSGSTLTLEMQSGDTITVVARAISFSSLNA
jgi:hypothetical protein